MVWKKQTLSDSPLGKSRKMRWRFNGAGQLLVCNHNVTFWEDASLSQIQLMYVCQETGLKYHPLTNKLRGLSPQVNYTERATAACRRSWCQLLRVEACHVVSVTDSYGRILGFLDLEPLLFFQVAPQLYSWGWVDPIPDPLLLRKSGSAGNRTRTSGPLTRNSDHYTT
jgi:hypothetical protein